MAATATGANGSVFFVSDTVGWVVAIPPDRLKMAIFRTGDGGAHWRLWGVSPAVGSPVGFSSTEVLIFTGSGMLRSSDGTQWESDSMPAFPNVESFNPPFFLPDLQHGWVSAEAVLPSGSHAVSPSDCKTYTPAQGGTVCGTTILWKTVDGGGSWQLQVQNSIDVGGLMTFWSSSSGALVDGSSLELTHDGGVTWQRSALLSGAASTFVDPPTMFDDQSGIVPINMSGSLYVSRTSDGGQTWSTPQLIQVSGSVFFLDDQRWLAREDLSLSISTDAGASWRSTKTTNPASNTTGVTLTTGIEVIRTRPGTVFALAPGEFGGVFASVTIDWGAHWHSVGMPQIYPSYRGVAGMGGWPFSI